MAHLSQLSLIHSIALDSKALKVDMNDQLRERIFIIENRTLDAYSETTGLNLKVQAVLKVLV